MTRIDLTRFDDVETDPVYEDPDQGFCEPVPDAPHTATFWTVYGHLKEGGVEDLIDCYDERSAERAANILEQALRMASVPRRPADVVVTDTIRTEEAAIKAALERTYGRLSRCTLHPAGSFDDDPAAFDFGLLGKRFRVRIGRDNGRNVAAFAGVQDDNDGPSALGPLRDALETARTELEVYHAGNSGDPDTRHALDVVNAALMRFPASAGQD